MNSISDNLACYIESEVNQWDFSGAIRVVKNGDIVYEMSRGYSDIEFDVKNTMQTRFSVASITKQFTAFAIMILYDRGLLKLDERANYYLNENMQISPEITVHNLLSHTSGLYNFYNFEDDFFVGDDRTIYNKTRFFNKWIIKTPVKEVGSEFNYNNSNYNLLAWIIEYVSGESFNNFIYNNMFVPLGMEHTEYDDGKKVISNKAVNYMHDYGVNVRTPYTNCLFSIGAGGLITNCDDLQKWYQCLRDKKLLSNHAYELYLKENLNHYCYGLERYNQYGTIKYSHGGDYLGVSTYIQHFFDDDICIIILSNTESLNQYRLGDSIADILYGIDPKKSVVLKEYPVSIDELKKYSGIYLPGKVQMEIKNGKLYLVRVNWDVHIELYCVGPDTFVRRYEEQKIPHKLLKEGDLKPSIWGYKLINSEIKQ